MNDGNGVLGGSAGIRTNGRDPASGPEFPSFALSSAEMRAVAQAVFDVHVCSRLIDVCAVCGMGNWPCAALVCATTMAEYASWVDQVSAWSIEADRAMKETADVAKYATAETNSIKEAAGLALGLVARDAPTIVGELNRIAV